MHDRCVHQYFVFPTLSVSKRLRNYDTHMWMAGAVQHATCVPLFVRGDKVTFGRDNDVSVEAWGAGSCRLAKAVASAKTN